MRWLALAVGVLACAALWIASATGERGLLVGVATGPPQLGGSATTSPSSLPPASPRQRRGGMEVTFLATSDTHFGHGAALDDEDPVPRTAAEAQGIEKAHLSAIEAMNWIPGRPFPSALGGEVGQPRGLLISGDLTEYGTPSNWARFEAFYGRDGTDGILRYPVFETIGNHDKFFGFFVKRRVAERHGAVRYSWNWQDLHIVCLGEAPDDEDLAWLQQDLAAQGREVGVVLYFHFPLAGPFSRNWFGDGDYRQKLGEVIAGYPVLGIFHGHYHAAGTYRWQGYDVYNLGSPKHSWPSFVVVRVTDERFTVASYNYQLERWWWWHDKPIFGAAGKRRSWFTSTAALIRGRSARASRP
ncbi:MAG: metallophosphoesterase [Deltaproteobacteria bacterium]|nr:metallophosphoesterase [Deltaproteobacteria bacterium]